MELEDGHIEEFFLPLTTHSFGSMTKCGGAGVQSSKRKEGVYGQSPGNMAAYHRKPVVNPRSDLLHQTKRDL